MKTILGKSYIPIALLFLISANPVFAECWIASDFKGYASNPADKFNTHEDGLSGQQIRININGKNSSVSGSEDLTFEEVTPQLIVGVYKSGGYKGTVESWGIDIEHKRAFYTQTRSGFNIFDGAKMFIGKLVGKCKQFTDNNSLHGIVRNGRSPHEFRQLERGKTNVTTQ